MTLNLMTIVLRPGHKPVVTLNPNLPEDVKALAERHFSDYTNRDDGRADGAGALRIRRDR